MHQSFWAESSCHWVRIEYKKNNNSIMLELIIENDIISNQFIKNTNTHRRFLSRIVKINENLEFISNDNNVISSLSYEMWENKN